MTEFKSYIDTNSEVIVLYSLTYGDERTIKDKHRGTPKEAKRLQKLRSEWRKWVIESDTITIYDGSDTQLRTAQIANIKGVEFRATFIGMNAPHLRLYAPFAPTLVEDLILLKEAPAELDLAHKAIDYIRGRKKALTTPPTPPQVVEEQTVPVKPAERVVQCGGCAARVAVPEGTTVQCKYCAQPVG